MGTHIVGATDEKEKGAVRRRGRPRKTQNVQGKKLFDEQSSSEEDSISGSDQDVEGEDNKQEEEDEEAPLIKSFRSSSKLRSLRVSREENGGQKSTVESGKATENLAASRTSGMSMILKYNLPVMRYWDCKFSCWNEISIQNLLVYTSLFGILDFS